MKFDAAYFDGNSSHIYQVTAEINHGSILLYHDTELVIWDVNKIIFEESYFNKHNTVLKYGEKFPYASLELTNEAFQGCLLKLNPQLKIKNTDIKFFQSLSNKSIVGIAAACVAFILLSYFVLIPALAELIATQVPPSYESELGENIYYQISEEFEIDEEKTQAANDFFNELNIKSNYPIQITVVNSPIKNAFALPGGHIVVYDEILQSMNSEEEFAALLCHEYSHVNLKHTTRSLFRSLGTYMVISLVLSDINGIMGVVIENAHNVKSLSYTRSLEEEADYNGLKLMLDAGINPQGMVNLFKHLKEPNEGSLEIPEFLSTHPLLDERIKNIEKKYKSKAIRFQKNEKLAEIWKRL
ncbi:MAG TPA: M48 family metallopeptidase [Bacteroidia bacterium]|nr:M48 family metallopeptidase [Bacteroidia bacterium]